MAKLEDDPRREAVREHIRQRLMLISPVKSLPRKPKQAPNESRV